MHNSLHLSYTNKTILRKLLWKILCIRQLTSLLFIDWNPVN